MDGQKGDGMKRTAIAVAAVLALVTPAGASVAATAASSKPAVSLAVADANVEVGERVIFSGKATGIRAASAMVQALTDGKWVNSGRVPVDKTGRIAFSTSFVVGGPTQVRVVVKAGKDAAISRPVTVTAWQWHYLSDMGVNTTTKWPATDEATTFLTFSIQESGEAIKKENFGKSAAWHSLAWSLDPGFGWADGRIFVYLGGLPGKCNRLRGIAGSGGHYNKLDAGFDWSIGIYAGNYSRHLKSPADPVAIDADIRGAETVHLFASAYAKDYQQGGVTLGIQGARVHCAF